MEKPSSDKPLDDILTGPVPEPPAAIRNSSRLVTPEEYAADPAIANLRKANARYYLPMYLEPKKSAHDRYMEDDEGKAGELPDELWDPS